ncbi:MAG: hypothetical protein KA533_00360 [Sphingobium sp.]|nr:hypothetical protein [Sphingobium sp.]
MMTVTAVIFPIALMVAVGIISSMLKSHGPKMLAALRLEVYPGKEIAPLPPTREKMVILGEPTKHANIGPARLAA